MSEADKKIKELVKQAIIRGDNDEGCPFGLSISEGCKLAGSLVDNMAPLEIMGKDSDEEEKSEIAKANNHLFRWKCPGKKCKYAGKLFEKNDNVVECNWDSVAAGISEENPVVGSPFYYKHFSGIGLDGLMSYPLGYYTDNSIDRGLYHGMYSIESTGNFDDEEMVKMAGALKDAAYMLEKKLMSDNNVINVGTGITKNGPTLFVWAHDLSVSDQYDKYFNGFPVVLRDAAEAHGR